MATINLLPNKKKFSGYHHSKIRNLIHQKIYNTERWRKLRLNYLMYHPVCEKCDKQLAIDVHHKEPIPNEPNNIQKMEQIGFNENNLEALCSECHKMIHWKTNLKNDWDI